MPTVNLGRVQPIFRGEYSALATYEPLDFVTYNTNTYYCIAESTGNLPSDTNYFRRLTSVDLGTIATQDADDVAITGGSVDGAVIGGDTPAALSATDADVDTLKADTIAAQNISMFATYDGTADAITLTTSPTFTPAEGTEIRFIPTATNTGASTAAINGGAAVEVLTVTGVATPAGYMISGHPCVGRINAAGKLVVRWEFEYSDSNANGDFMKWSDGRMVANIPPSVTGRFGTGNDEATITFPVSFFLPTATARDDMCIQLTAIAFNDNTVEHVFQVRTVSAGSSLIQYRPGSTGADADVYITIFGKWY